MADKVKNSRFPVFAVIIIIFAAALIFSRFFREPVKTEIVRYGVAENKKSVSAYIIRSENVLNAPESGLLVCSASENRLVANGEKVASVYAGEYDSDLQLKLKTLNERINQLENTAKDKSFYVVDAAAAENSIYTRVDNIISAVYNKDVSYAPQYKEDLNKLIQNLKGQKGDTTDTLAQLKQQRDEARQQLSSVSADIYSTSSGAFSSNIDGYESYFSIDKLNSITPSYLKKADSAKENAEKNAVAGKPAVKICNSFLWYTAAVVDKDWTSNLKVGDSVKLRFPGVSDSTVSALVSYISPPENNSVAIVISCGEFVDNIFSVRKTDAEIIKASYSGFKISKEAVRVLKDGTNGVYVLNDRTAKFKTVDILYNGDNYIIARENNSQSGNVLLYDEVILNSARLHDGMVVN